MFQKLYVYVINKNLIGHIENLMLHVEQRVYVHMTYMVQ